MEAAIKNDSVVREERKPIPAIIATVAVMMSIVFTCATQAVNPAMTSIMAYFGVTTGETGLILTFNAIIGLVLAIPGGRLYVKFGPRVLGTFAFACCILGNTLGYFATSFAMLLVGAAIQGVAFSMSALMGPAMIAAVYPPERRGLPLAILSANVGIGTMLILNLANLVLDAANPASWKNVWLLNICLLVIMFVVFLIFVRMPKPESEMSEQEHAKGVIGPVLRNPRVWLCMLMFFGFSCGTQVGTSFASTYFQNGLGMDLAQANTLSSMLPLSMVIGALVLGVILSKFPKFYLFLVIGAVMSAIAFAAVFSTSAEMAPFVMVFVGVSLAILPPCVQSIASTIVSPALVGMAMGMISFANACTLVAPAIQGYVMANIGWGGAAVVQGIFGLICVVAAIGLAIIHRRDVANGTAA